MRRRTKKLKTEQRTLGGDIPNLGTSRRFRRAFCSSVRCCTLSCGVIFTGTSAICWRFCNVFSQLHALLSDLRISSETRSCRKRKHLHSAPQFVRRCVHPIKASGDEHEAGIIDVHVRRSCRVVLMFRAKRNFCFSSGWRRLI